MISLELTSLDGGSLAPFTPGAHIDVHLGPDLVRQYSLCSDPADTGRYRVAVRAVAGGQASQFIHHTLRPGALLRVSEPRNNFPLLPSDNYLFIAGGIGITPLLPMLHAARAAGANWTLLYCVHTRGDAAFLGEIDGLVELHVSDEGTRLDVAGVLAVPLPDTLVYCCGPERLMLAVEQATAHWPEGNTHFEWFQPRTRETTDSVGAFQVLCAQSGITVVVPPDRSILAVLADAGVTLSSSCEQGICGTCECRVLEGEIEHRDSILSAAEQAEGTIMMACVSRAKGARLVLDL